MAELAEMLLALLSKVWVVHQYLHNGIDKAGLATIVLQGEPWHSVLPESTILENFRHLQRTVSR